MSDSDALPFTGERLHDDDALFAVDLMRHRAAYHAAIRLAREIGARRLLELGSGTGYGAAMIALALAERPEALAESGAASGAAKVVALDRVAPLTRHRGAGPRFVRADLAALPLTGPRFDLAFSFQVVEHLAEPAPLVDALAERLAPEGVALVSTPNADFSDGENPYHVREYTADALHALLAPRFASVELCGVSARGEALRYHEARLARIRRIVRLDPLGLRRRLPTALVERLFAGFARVVRKGIAADDGLPPVSLEDFPIEPAHPRALDLLAVCRGPRPRSD